MKKGSVYRERTYLWYLVAFLVFFLVGGGALWVAETEFMKGYPGLRSVVSNIGGLTIASLGLGVVWELLGKRALVGEVFESAQVSQEVQAAKLFGVTTQFQEGVQWTELLRDAREIEMMVAAARTWRSTLSHSLLELALRPGSKITLILPDPTNDDVMSVLADRFSSTPIGVAEVIRETESHFKEMVEKSTGKKKCQLVIWYLNEAPLFTFYRIDDAYVLTTYRHGGKGNVPTFVCRKGGCIANFIEEQKSLMLNKSSKLARQVFPSVPKSDTTQIDTDHVNAAEDKSSKSRD